MAGLEDISDHLLPRRKTWLRDRNTWIMLHRGRDVRSPTDYILIIYRRLLKNVSVWGVYHNTDRYFFLVCLRVAAPAENSRYIRKWKRFTLKPPNTPG